MRDLGVTSCQLVRRLAAAGCLSGQRLGDCAIQMERDCHDTSVTVQVLRAGSSPVHRPGAPAPGRARPHRNPTSPGPGRRPPQNPHGRYGTLYKLNVFPAWVSRSSCPVNGVSATQTWRSTATALPMMVASSTRIGVNMGSGGSAKTCCRARRVGTFADAQTPSVKPRSRTRMLGQPPPTDRSPRPRLGPGSCCGRGPAVWCRATKRTVPRHWRGRAAADRVACR